MQLARLPGIRNSPYGTQFAKGIVQCEGNSRSRLITYERRESLRLAQ